MPIQRKKILCVFGTRPEAIKMAPVIRALKTHSTKLITKVCVTAQHRHMLDDVLEVFKIRSDYDLNVMEQGQSLEHITKAVIDRIAPVLKKEKPDLSLVHGDTSTTLLTALACFYQRIPIGHVEAGLRTYDYDHPFPEEANRRLADAICTLHFAPTVTSKRNLLNERISSKNIFVTGNTVIDALQWAVAQTHMFENPILKRCFAVRNHNLNSPAILVTAHRRENFGKPLMNICQALRAVAESFPESRIFYPVHLNPNVQSVVKKVLSNHPGIVLLPPLNYLDFCHLMKKCALVVTDSGGLQEEAPSIGKPVLVLRQVTERPEAVKYGTVRIIGTDKSRIIAEISRLLIDHALYKKMAAATNPYGDGRAAQRIVRAILYFFKLAGKKIKGFTPG